MGMKPGDRVGLFGGNSWEWVVSYYGIAKIGAVLNPLSSMLTSNELAYTVTDACARVVIASFDKAGPRLYRVPLTDIVGAFRFDRAVRGNEIDFV